VASHKRNPPATRTGRKGIVIYFEQHVAAAIRHLASECDATNQELGEMASVGSGRDQTSVVKIPPTGIPLVDVERHALVEALKMSNWVQKDAAELLSISPRVMNYKIKMLAIEFPRGRRAAPLESSAAMAG